jgi:DNA polymerase-3 subunit delta'
VSAATAPAPSPPGGSPPPEGLLGATRHQRRAGAELGATLAAGPTHAYLFRGPRGSGKAEAARAFAAELLAAGSPRPDDSRRRALIDPSPHPDLVWLRPPGAQHLVDDVREMVIRAAALRPIEGDRRVFVIEEAEALRDESQNALLKTLEEPAPFAHLILLCSEPELLLATIVSRCRPVEFAPLAPEAVLERLAEEGGEAGAAGEEAEAAARLCGGDWELARLLLTGEGRELRSSAETAARAALASPAGERPWGRMLEGAEALGADAAAAEEARLLELAGGGVGRRGRGARLTREDTEQVKRAERRERTRALDLGLSLCAAWYRDLGAVSAGAGGVVLNSDRAAELAGEAEGIDPARATAAVELVLDTRRRLRLNVAEELALDALWLRLSHALSHTLA